MLLKNWKTIRRRKEKKRDGGLAGFVQNKIIHN